MVVDALDWSFGAKVVPLTVGGMALLFITLSLINQVFRKPESEAAGIGDEAKSAVQERIHMDLASDTQHLPVRVVLLRGGLFFGWLLAFMASMATIGLIPTAPLFVIAYMRLEGNEPWKLVLPQAICLTLFIYVLFDKLLTIPWPPTLMGYLIPALKVIPSM
jgi:hypothetical protein